MIKSLSRKYTKQQVTYSAFSSCEVVAIQHLSGHYRKRETFDSCIFPQESWDKVGFRLTSYLCF
jgi:hypothetical protein